MNYKLSCRSCAGSCNLEKEKIIFTSYKDNVNAFFKMKVDFPEWEEDCYVMMPACAYNANKLKRVVRSYPPMYLPEEAGVHCEPLMTDVPALNPDGSGSIQVTSGDMATPCVGIFNRQGKESFFIFTMQEIKGKNLGFTMQRGMLEISYPASRTDIYRFCLPHDKEGDKGISVSEGESVRSDFRIFSYKCENICEFYKQFFKLRKVLLHDERAPFLYTKELWNVMETYFNKYAWSGEYYARPSLVWTCGWVGGPIATLPLIKAGTELTAERAKKTLDFQVAHQAQSGFYYGSVAKGVIRDDSFGTPGMENLHLVRASADGLYFFLKNFGVTEPKKEWIDSTEKCADAFVRLFERYGTFGQFINVETGDMVVGCSLSASMAPGALAKAWEYFGKDKYLQIAKKALDYYYSEFIRTGITNGGPGEILSAPDSESGFELFESCMVLYETDKDEKWLEYAKTVIHYCSSWVVSYAYKFPKSSEFCRLKINSVGSVFANVQNKHSAPGIAVLSGDSIYKLYKITGNNEYLELIKDIAYFLPQCVSTEERPFYSWDVPSVKQPAGYMGERVNMSDWEWSRNVGGVQNGSTWPTFSLMLTFVELMEYDEMRGQGAEKK